MKTAYIQVIFNRLIKIVIFILIPSIAIGGFFIFKNINTAKAVADIHYVTQGGTGDCSSWELACGDIQTAITAAASDDTIAVKAGTYAVTGAPIIVDKSVNIIGYKSDQTTPAYTLYDTGEVNGPDLTMGADLGTMFVFSADQIQLSGFHINTSVSGGAIAAISIVSEIKYPIIQYNRFDLDENDSAVNVGATGKIIAPAGINFNIFDGPASAQSFWFKLEAGGEIDWLFDGSLPEELGYSFFSLSFYHNTISNASAYFLLGDGVDSTGIQNVIFLYNTFSDVLGGIAFDEIDDAASSAKINDIYVMYNTFNNSTSLANQFAVLIGAGLDDTDVTHGWSNDLLIFFNKFLQERDATYPTVGFENSDLTSPSDDVIAWANWWGSADGPTNFTTGSSSQATVSNHVNVNPWSSASDLSGLYFDKASFTSLDANDGFLPAAFYTALKEGSFTIPLPSFITDPESLFNEEAMLEGSQEYNYDILKPPYITVYNQVIIEIAYNGGNIIATLPSGTKITPATGSTLDIAQLVARAKETTAISGLPSGSTIYGATELGIPNLGLNFDKPVEIKIYVGTNLNGQTLNIRRSITGTGDWTTEGMYLSSNCVVSGGYCTFQTVKASTFAVAKIPSSQILPETGKDSD